MTLMPERRWFRPSTLAALVAVLLLPTLPAPAQNPAMESAGSDPIALIEADPELAGLVDDWEAQHSAWNDDLRCALLLSGQPVVRVAAFRAWPLGPGEGAFCPTEEGELVDPREVYEQALRDAPDDPTLLLLRFWSDCTELRDQQLCDREAALSRLLALEPDNAFYHLLPMMSDRWQLDVFSQMMSKNPPAELSPEQLGELLPERATLSAPADFNVLARDLILTASQAAFFDSHFHAHRYAVYREVREFVASQPPPQPSKRLEQALVTHDLEAMLHPQDPAYLPSMMFQLESVPMSATSFSKVLRHCDDAQNQGDKPLVTACNTLAELIINTGKTAFAVRYGGRTLQRRMRQGPVEDSPAAQALSNQNASWEGLLSFCESTRLLNNPARWHTLPPDHQAQFVRDLSREGELVALRRAAQREYAVDPTLFVLDPGKCQDARALDESTKQAILKPWRNPGNGKTGKIKDSLAALAEQLEATSRAGPQT